MAYEKIATCCYCGTRAALVLSGKQRHELACSSCGAQLHNMKRVPSAKAASHDVSMEEAAQPLGGFFAGKTDKKALQQMRKKKSKSKSSKKRKSGWSRLFDEAFDVIEDIFD